jgi:hypothetical protein
MIDLQIDKPIPIKQSAVCLEHRRFDRTIACVVSPRPNVRSWHKADILDALMTVRSWEQSGLDLTLLTKRGF